MFLRLFCESVAGRALRILNPAAIDGFRQTSERPARFVAKRITQMMPNKALYKVSASMKLDYLFI